jgi:hypothetical protein
MPVIVFDESEQLESDFTDYTLRVIQELYGPQVKDWLLLPGPVPISTKIAVNE